MPDHPTIEEHFGKHEQGNQYGDYPNGLSMARISVLYDCINEMGIDALISRYDDNEYDLAKRHIERCAEPDDLIIFDRGYGSFELFAQMMKGGTNFLCRLKKGGFNEAKALFKDDVAGVSKIVNLKTIRQKHSKLRKLGLPNKLRLRFVTVRLSTGELEVLVTSLIDKKRYPTETFESLYFMRWKVETYYSRLKGRLDIENFSGKTLESVLQDFHSTVLVSNVESLMSGIAQDKMNNEVPGKSKKYQLNKSVGFHAVKDRAMEIFLSDKIKPEDANDRLIELFFGQMNYIRNNREVDRKEISRCRTIRFLKTKRKVTY